MLVHAHFALQIGEDLVAIVVGGRYHTEDEAIVAGMIGELGGKAHKSYKLKVEGEDRATGRIDGAVPLVSVGQPK